MNVVKKCIYILLLCNFLLVLGCAPTSRAENDSALSRDGTTSAGNEEQQCIDISGSYEMLGKALPGMPEYFIVKALPLSLDGMLGLDLPDDQRKIVDRVNFLKRKGAILVLFLAGDHLVKQKEIPITTKSISCDASSLTIVRFAHVSSEGTPNTIKVVTKVSLEKDGTLQIMVTRLGRARGLIFFPFSWHEEYGAYFAKVLNNGISKERPIP